MNTAEDIKRMLGELVDEAIRIGRAEGEKTLGTDAQLKEQVKRLVDEKQMLAQKMNVLAGENDFLEDENEALRAKVDSYDGVSREQAAEVVRLKEQAKKMEDENNDLREQLDKLAEENDELEEANRKFAFDIVELDMKIKEQAEALAIYRVPTPRACPFCGGPAEVHQLHKDEWYVVCPSEDCPVNPETNTFDTEADAIEAWNHSYDVPKVTCDWR